MTNRESVSSQKAADKSPTTTIEAQISSRTTIEYQSTRDEVRLDDGARSKVVDYGAGGSNEILMAWKTFCATLVKC